LTKRVEILIELVETGSIHLHHTIKVHSLKKNVTANCLQSNNNLFLSGEMGIFFSLNQWQEEEMRISEMHCSLHGLIDFAVNFEFVRHLFWR
jgi:hypothetical protein